MLKRPSTSSLMVDLAQENDVIKLSVLPFIEVGHSNIADDVRLFTQTNHFKRFFADYAYSRGPKINDKDSWDPQPNDDLISLSSRFPENVVENSPILDDKKVIPTISKPYEYEDLHDLIEHYFTLINKYRDYGYGQIAVRLEHNRRGMSNPADLFRDVIKRLNANDFVFIDSKTNVLAISRYKDFEDSINNNVSRIKSINSNVNVAILNPEFDLKGISDDRIRRHNHGSALLKNNQIYGYGNYVTEYETDMKGPNPVPYSVSYYDYNSGNTIRFDSGTSIKDTLQIMADNDYAMQLIRDHKGHCSSCKTLEEYIDDPDEGEKKLRNNKRKGQIRREHFVNSIVIDEMSNSSPATY